jgi:anaerobic selenocysteine-containing dehydrogenase
LVGPESLGILSPARRTYSEYLFRFLIAHGSPNYGHSGICAMQKAFAFCYTLGAEPRPDLARSNLIVIWGKQPAFSGAPMGHLKTILDTQARGA